MAGNQSDDADLDRDGDHVNDSLDEINEEMAAPSSVKKKFKKIRDERHNDDEEDDIEENVTVKKKKDFADDPDI